MEREERGCRDKRESEDMKHVNENETGSEMGERSSKLVSECVCMCVSVCVRACACVRLTRYRKNGKGMRGASQSR